MFVQNIKNKSEKKLGVLVIILLILGIFFRFANLDQKVYWLDETHTSLRIFGYTEPEFIKDIFTGKIVNSEDLLKYQQPSPEKGWNDTIKIVSGNTEHAPLYYFLLRGWATFFGSSVAALRSFSALISLFIFPSVYWLAQELFASSLVGWIAIALLAVSPFQVLYAQETRPYALLTVAILLASAALLRAIRVNTKASWSVYAITVAFGFYTHWFFVVIAFSHGVYMAITERFRLKRNLIAYLFASLAGILAFSPWIINTITAPPPLEGQMGWVFQKVSWLTLVKSWGLSLSRAFFDVDRGGCFPLGNVNCRYWFSYDESLIYFLMIPLIFLVGYALYFLCRHAPQRVWLFIFTLIGIMALALIVPDLIKGGQRSTVTRYLIPCLLGFQLAVAYLLANKMTAGSSLAWQQKLWQILFAILISLGVFSCILITDADSWWSKGGNYHVTPIATIFNKAEHPILLYS
ncbi:MAG: glycosyltransferase family 39 protein, partial [Microcystaceae cyanobacterium]